MITGAHVMIYSRDAEADRAFFLNVLKFPHVDVGGGWLIFALPPAELGVHPIDGEDTHDLSLMCADVEAFAAAMKRHDVPCTAPEEVGWGRSVFITLPGGSALRVYQPNYRSPKA